MLVTLDHIDKSFGADQVLYGIDLAIQEQDRIGLLGVNGAGKSTLLDIIAQKIPYDAGTLHIKSGARIGYLEQNDALDPDRTLDAEIRDAFSPLLRIQQRMEQISEQMAQADSDPAQFQQLQAEYGRLADRFEKNEGYQIDYKINRVLTGMGFSDYDRNQKTRELSGGEKMRFAIAKMLLSTPDLLILDEPTNHLDFKTLGWLEAYLKEYRGAVLVVSHDRYFLDRVAQDICEIEDGRLTRYKGGYSSFVRQKAERQKTAMQEYEKQQQEIAKMREYVAKNLAKSSSTNSVGSRVKALEKMEKLAKPKPEYKGISLSFSYEGEPHKQVLRVKQLGIRVGEGAHERQLFRGIDLEVTRGEKIAFVGKNGVGKSSLIRAIQGRMPHDGLVEWGEHVKIGYFEQENAQLNLEHTVLEEVQGRFFQKPVLQIRSMLARMLLTEDAVYKKIKHLSGANRAKVAFCILMLEQPNVLILDEPSNHLDYQAKEALDEALCAYTGTLLMVSHDRYLLSRVPSRIIEMEPAGLTSYLGQYDDYVRKKQEIAQAAQAQQPKPQKASGPEKAKPKREKRVNTARIGILERRMEELEGQIACEQKRLEDPEVFADYQRTQEVTEIIAQLQSQLDEVMEEWVLRMDQA